MDRKRVSSVFGMYVYLDDGTFFGVVDDVICDKQKIVALKVKVSPNILVKNKNLANLVRSGKEIAVHWDSVKALGDIIIITRDILRA